MVNKKPSGRNSNKKKIKPGTIEKPAYEVNYYLGAILTLITFLLYINGINHGYLLDDSAAISENNYVQMGIYGIPKLLTTDFWHFSAVRLGYYRPLSVITFAVEFQFFGFSPHISHLVNAVLFAITVFSLYVLLSYLFNTYNLLFPFIAALLFAVHPIHTEVIDNIKGRDEILSFLNIIVMLIFALKYYKYEKKKFLLISLVFFYLALLSKETALTGLFLVPLVYWYFEKKPIQFIAKKTVPFVLVAILFFIQKNLLFEAKDLIALTDPINYPYTNDLVKYSSAFMLFLYSIKILVFPYTLRYEYGFNQIPAVGWDNLFALSGLLVFSGLIILTLFQVRRRSRLGFALGFFIITMTPLLAFIIMKGGIFAERLTFFPSLGFCIMVPLLFEKISKVDLKVPVSIKSVFGSRYLSMIIPILFIAVIFSFKTYTRNRVWNNELSLYGADIKTGKNSAQNQLHYAAYWLRLAQGEKKDSVKRELYLNTALNALHQALIILPGFADALYSVGFAYETRAAAYPDRKSLDSAIYYFNYAIQCSPNHFMSYYHLGNLYEWQSRYDAASYYYNQAHNLIPEYQPVIEKVKEMKEKRGMDVKSNPLTNPKAF